VVGAGGRGMHVRVTADREQRTPGSESMEHWFKEHQWGFGTSRRGETLMYEVRHPVWAVHHNARHDLEFDWAGVYGKEWGFLQDAKPKSVVLAAGSPVAVYPKRSLKDLPRNG
jgi:uncharacterized protein